jgi:hypothetical protein
MLVHSYGRFFTNNIRTTQKITARDLEGLLNWGASVACFAYIFSNSVIH